MGSGYSAATPVYLNAREELIELAGEDIYQRLVVELDQRVAGTPVSLPK